MAVITVSGPISNKGYKFRIAGDAPTVDEQRWIDSRISQKEQAFQQEYAQAFGAPVDTGESEGLLNYLGEIPKGLARGAVGFGETAGLGLATLLPEDYELPTREFIRQQAYNFSPQADIGLEDSTVGTVSEGIGSIVPLYATALIPGVGVPLSGGLAIAAGAGEASERARAAGATQEQRNRAALFGAGVGALDLIPIFGSMKKYLGPTLSNKLANYLVNVVMEGGEEAAQEATTQVLQNMIEQGYDPDQDLGEGTLASAGVGGLAGALIAAILPGRNHSAPPAGAPPAPGSSNTADAARGAIEAAAEGADDEQTPAAPPTPGFVNTVPRESLPGAKPTAAAPTPEESMLDELKAETADDYGLPFDQLQAIHDRIEASPDKIGAITQIAAELEISPEEAQKLYADVKGVLDHSKKRGISAVPNPIPTGSAAPTGQPTVRAKAPKAPKVGTQATEGTAPTASPKLKPKRYNALRAAGLTDEQINSMTPEQHQAVLTNPAASGVGAPPPAPAPKADGITEEDVKGPEAAPAPTLKPIPFDQYARKPDSEELVPGTNVRGEAPIIDMGGRKIVLVDVNGVQVPYYLSSGKAGKKGVPAGKWYPILGIGSDGWINKGTEADIANYYGSAELKAMAETLDATIGDIRNDNTVPKAKLNGAHIDAINAGLNPVGNGQADTIERFNANLADLLDRLKRGGSSPDAAPEADPVMAESEVTPAPEAPAPAAEPTPEPTPEAAPAAEPKFKHPEGAPFTRPLTEEEFQTLSDADKARYEADPNMPPTRELLRQRDGNTTPAIWASKDFDIPVDMLPEPAQTDPKTGEKYQKVRQQDGNIGFAPVSQLRPVPTAPKSQEVSPNAAPGQVTGTAGQIIPPPVRVPQKPKTETKVAEEGKTPEQIEAERAAAEKEVGDNKAAQDKLNARWQAWVAANPDLADIVLDNYTPAGKNAEGKTIGRDPTSSADKQAILDLLGKKSLEGKENAGAKNAQRYFTKVPNPGEALEMMAYDAIYAEGAIYRTPPDMEGTAEAKFLQGTGKAQAASAIEWVQANLSPKAATFVAEETALNQRLLKAELENAKNKKDRVRDGRKYKLNRMAKEEADALEKQLEELRKADEAAYNARSDFQNRELAKDMAETQKQVQRENSVDPRAGRKPTMPVPSWGILLGLDGRIGLGLPLHPVAKQALARGDLKAALNVIAATTPNPRLARIAEKLATKVGNTKVQVVSGLTNYKGQPVRGAFDPKTNTVMVDAENGMDVHTVLHEMVHAATVQTLANKMHPLTKRLEKLYADLKDVLVNTYGGSSLEEFVSEASSNPEFQAMLEQLQEKGSKVTAWSRFKNAVGNFLRGLVGMPPVQPNALATVDSLIDAILDPAPDTSNLGPLYMAANDPAEARKVLNATLRNGREPTKANLRDAGARIIEGGSGLNRMVMKGLMQITPLHLLVQQAGKYFPSAARLNDLVNEASADFSRSRDTLNEFTSGLHKYMRKLSPEKRELWNTVAHDATYFEVEPWLPEAEAKKRYGKGDDVMGKLKQYDRLKPMWESMDPEGKKQLLTAVNYFKKLRNDALESAEMTLAALFPGDKATKDIIWKSFNARLLAKGTVEPYLPLFREGDYVLTFNAFNPDTGTVEVYSHRFTSERERAAYREEVMPLIMESLQRDLTLSAEDAAKRMDMRESVGRQNVNYSNVPPQSFVGQLMAKMAQKKVDPDVMRAVTELVIDTLPETAYAKSFKSRTGVFGATAHMDKAIIERASSLSRQQVQAKHRGAFSRIKNDLTKEYDENPVTRNSVGARDMLDQFHAIADFAANPTRSKSSRIAMNVGFLYTLGFNPSSALLNFFQLPGIVLPYLSGKYGMRSSMSAMREARIAMMSSGYTREVEVVTDKLGPDGKPIVERQRVRSAPSIINYDFNAANMDERTRRLKFLVEEGEKLGQFNRSQIYDILDMDGVDGLGSKLNAASGFMMHHSERMVREVTLASTYQLEVDRMAKEKGRPLTDAEFREAAREAIRVAEDTNGGIAAGATPRIAHTGLGAAIFMYKRFAVTMYGLLIKTTYQALKGQSPEARKIARYQLAGIFGMTGMLAGVAGMPLYGVLAAVFNLFRDDEEEDFQTLTRMYMGDGIYRGLVNHLTGINVATRIGLSDLLFRDNLVEKDQSALWTLVEQVGGPVVGTILNVERGISLWNEGEYWRGFENMVPAALRAPIRAFRFETQGAETMDGKPIVEDFSPVEIAAQALGFNPASYQNQLEDNAKKKKFERAVLERRKKLLDNYFYAYFNSDTDTMQDVIEDIYEFSQEYPELKIDGETLRDSQRQRTRSRQNAYHGLTLNDALRARVEAFGSVT